MPDTSAVPPYDAIILAGGRGSRLGGVDKAQVQLAGAPLIDRPLAACASARRVVVVGPPSAVAHLRGNQDRDAPDSVGGGPADRVRVTRERPPGGGPGAATAAGLAALHGERTPWIVLLSCDLPLAEDGVHRLLDAAAADPGAAEGGSDGYLLVDDEGRRQWLFGIYRADRLTAAVRRHPDPAGMSMRRLLDGLALVSVAESGDVSADLDTWADHAAWTARLEK